MPNTTETPVGNPYSAFDFSVEIDVPAVAGKLAQAAFAECDGIETTFDLKTIREGGNNGSLLRLLGMAGFGTLTLKRGVTDNFDLWRWIAAIQDGETLKLRTALRATTKIVLHAPDRSTVRATWIAERCLPTRLKAPPLNARDGIVAIEELQLAYESLRFVAPGA